MTGEISPKAGADTRHPEPPGRERWRRLTLYAYRAIDGALDADPAERVAILTEAAAALEGAIAELDGAA